MATDAAIEELNRTEVDTRHAHNAASTWTKAELAKRNGYIPTTEKTTDLVHSADPNEVLASTVNWVNAGAVTPVKDQAQCGSCWSFSTTGAIEGMYQIATGNLISRSEQELVSCDKYSFGCNGGNYSTAFKWLQTHKLNTEANYPYTSSAGVTGTCNTALESDGIEDASHVQVERLSDSSLRSALNKQPVSISVAASSRYFGTYSTGIMTNYSACGDDVDHAILAVGYGSDYFIVKNSWGTTWGQEGYAQIGSNVEGAPAAGVCSILYDPAYPNFQ